MIEIIQVLVIQETLIKNDAITLNDNDKNAYLADAGNGYEFNSVNPESLVISTDISKNVINVLYILLKKFSYTDEAITKKSKYEYCNKFR